MIRAVLFIARDEWEWIERAPQVKLLKEPKKRVRWITPEQARELIDTIPSHLGDMAEFTLATGLRQSNVSYLRWDQVSLVRGMAWIHADESKNRKASAVPLNRTAMAVLQRRVGKDKKFVFTFDAESVQRTSTRAWGKALDRVGITEFRWNDLRHTWPSWHVQRGTSLQELMELGGWSSYEMVLRYAHLAGGHLKHVAQRLEDTELAQPEQSTCLH